MEFKSVTIWEMSTYIVRVPDAMDAKEAVFNPLNRIGVVKRLTGAEANFNPPVNAVKRVADVSPEEFEAAKAVLPEVKPDPTS